MGGEAGLAAAIRQTAQAFSQSADMMAASSAHCMTGFAIITWDTRGQPLIQAHYSMHSGIEPGDAPALVSAALDECNTLAALEARHGARA